MEIHKQAFLSGLVFADDKDQKKAQWRPSIWPPCLGDCRLTHGSVVVRRDGEEILVLLGGLMNNNYDAFTNDWIESNSVVYFNVQSKMWQEGPSLHEKRACPASVLCNNAIYVIGGCNSSNSLDTIERIQVDDLVHSSASIKDTSRWKKLECRLSTRRYDCAAAVVHDRLIVVAGGKCPSLQDEFSFVEIIDTASGNACTIIPGPSLHHARCCFGMAVVGQRIYVVGGVSTKSVEYLNFDDLFSSSKSWTIHRKLHLNISAEVHALVQVGSCLITVGGCRRRSKRPVEVLDTVNNITWELPNMTVDRLVCSMVALSSGIVAMNGYDSSSGIVAMNDDSFETLSLVDKNSWLFARLLSIGKVPI